MKSFLSLSACLIGILALSGCATKSDESTSLEKRFKRADQDGNGNISRKEYEDYMIEEMFALFDEDGNGTISEAEFIADGGTAKTFKKLNRSGSGQLTLDEAKSSQLIRDHLAAPFNEADTNKSGSVTWDEFEVYRAKARDYVR
ncbi:MAG: EF-hand domain-containing protein [Chthoniobacterales bacterium]